MEYKLEIRRATIGDAQNISELICELSIIYICHEFTKEGADALLASMSPDAIRKYIEAGYQYHVAEISNRLIGISGVKDNSHLYHLFVAEKYHRQGIGNQLIGIITDYCKENKFQYLTVKTLDESVNYEPYDKTRAFYLKEGFIPLEVFKTFWNEENPCLFMVKKI